MPKVSESLRRVLKEDKLANGWSPSTTSARSIWPLLWNVGAVYPLLRTHTLLSALHPLMHETPLVLFYPGRYDGYSLRLFNKLSEDHYYRAFRLVF